MARPSGWDILGLDRDPTPGVVESVEALAKQFGDFAHDVEAAYRSLNSFGGDATSLAWVGQTADAFKSNFGPLPGRLQKLYTSYSEASDALSAYAPKLLAAQNKADSALRQAQDAHADLQRATTAAHSAAHDLKTAQQNQAAVPNPQAVTDAQTAHDTAQKNLDTAKSRLDALTAQAKQAHDDRIAAAKECAKALHHAQSDGIHNKHWWEHVGEVLSEWGGKIAEIANDLAPFLDVLALATSWIPGVDVVTAALAEADNLIALAGTGMEIVGDGMQGHWGDALMGAGMLGATFLGGKAISKLGGKAFESLSSKFGKEAEGAENAVGSEARSANGVSKSCTGGDPVDLISGEVVMTETDLELPGVLPVVLRRTYASGYETGRLFGPGWSSTLDERLSINDAGIHFTGDDGQTLHYDLPVAGEEVLPARGARWPLTWDRDTDQIRISDPANALTRHFPAIHYRDELGQIRDLAAITDRNGNRIEILRDEHGTPTGVEHPGYRIALETRATRSGPRLVGMRLLGHADEGGTAVKQYLYDARGRLVGVIDSSEVPYSYEWDDDDRITAWVDRVGYHYCYSYGADGRVVRGVGDGGYLSASFEYRDEERITVLTDSLGHQTVYRYDENGHIAAQTDALGSTVLTEYDLYGRLLSRTDALGNRTAYEYDDRGNVVRGVRPDGGTVDAGFNRLNQILTVRLPDGATWHREYDERGNLLSITDPAGARTAYSYWENGAPRSVTGPLGDTSWFETDSSGLPIAITDPLGVVTHLTRDPFGRVVFATDSVGRTAGWGFTTEGLPTWQTNADGGQTRWSYDAAGRVLSVVDPNGAVTTFEPGPFGTIAARTDVNGVRYEFTHDGELRTTVVANTAGAVWTYAYDAAGRLVAENDFIGRAVEYGYDAIGRLTSRVTGIGQRVEFDYDAGGRVAGRRMPEGEFRYEYDPLGRLLRAFGPGSELEYTRDANGRVISEVVDGRKTVYEYDASGLRVRRITPSGAVSAWSFDLGGRAVTLEAGSAGRLEFTRDPAGREIDRLIGPGTRLSRSLDEAGRLTSLQLWTEHSASSGQRELQLSRDWEYRRDGVPTAVTDQYSGPRRLAADAMGRVTAVHAATWTESYAYDAFGNVNVADTPVADDTVGDRDIDRTLIRRAGRTSYEHDDAGRLVRAVRRTLDGRRLVWQYTWDTEDRLIRAVVPDGTTWLYAYDPLGRRVSKTRMDTEGHVGERTTFAWDGPRLSEQHVYRSGMSVETMTWDYEPGTFAPSAQRRRITTTETDSTAGYEQRVVDEAFYAIVTDLVGTPTELVTADGRIVWHTTTSLWGRVLATSAEHGVACPLRFPGQYHDDETGLHYNLNRYYDPDTAAYLTPDPLGLGPAPNDRTYVSNPMTWVDPLGLACTDTALGYQKAGAKKWAEDNGFTHYMKPEFIDTWRGYVRSDIANPNQTIHGLTEGFGPEGFEGMAAAGLKPGSEATQQEMGWVARSVIHEQRPWSSIKFYDKNGRIDVPEPKWYDPKWEKAWIFGEV